MSARRFILPAVAAILLGLLAAPPAAAARQSADPAGLVNPFIGTGSGGPVVGEVVQAFSVPLGPSFVIFDG